MANRKIGLSTLYMLGKPFDRMVEEIPRTGSRYIEVIDDAEHALDKKRVAALKSAGKSCEVEFAVHAPFAGINIALQSRYLLNAMLKRLKKSILNASALECRIWVFHPGMRSAVSGFYPGEDWVVNLESVRLLSEFAEGQGVKVAIENITEPFVLKNVDEFRRFYVESNLDVGLALDTGHANLVGELEGFLRAFPDRIVHVHAHDNFGEKDEHLGIGYGNINWESFGKLMKNVSSDGIVVVESVEHLEESVQRLSQLLD